MDLLLTICLGTNLLLTWLLSMDPLGSPEYKDWLSSPKQPLS